MANAESFPVLRITQPTYLKRRVAPADALGPDEKILKQPSRIPLQSYAYTVAGQDLQNHVKATFKGSYEGSTVWYVYRGHCVIEDEKVQQQAAKPVTSPLVLRIVRPTVLKRRIAPVESLSDKEKISKGPSRIPLHSYAYEVPGENLQGYLKVAFNGPISSSSVWYVPKADVVIEDLSKPQTPKPAAGSASSGASKGQPSRINQAGLDLLKQFEGLRLQAYICPAGVPTIGYGTTSGVKMGDRVTSAQAEALLRRDLQKFERAVKSAVKVPVNENQFSALVSFTYNVGFGAFQRSTLLKVLNQGNYQGAAREFMKWNKGGGRVLPGLTRRRQAEQKLFLKKA